MLRFISVERYTIQEQPTSNWMVRGRSLALTYVVRFAWNLLAMGFSCFCRLRIYQFCTWGQFYLFFVVGTTFDDRQNGTIVLSIDLWSMTMAKRYWAQ